MDFKCHGASYAGIMNGRFSREGVIGNRKSFQAEDAVGDEGCGASEVEFQGGGN